MNRRRCITLLGGTAATWPLAARVQGALVPVVGYLHQGSPETMTNQVAAFQQGLSESGYIESRNLAIEYRWAERPMR
jgi:putative ABC transport system substrate-binding protein